MADKYSLHLETLPFNLLHIAQSFANDNKSPKIEPVHLFRALLHKSAGLVSFIEDTLDEDYYYSGGFKICYSEINHIEVEDEVYTSKALVVVCKLMKDEKVIGYDRMVAQDFICLKAKIDEKTKIVKKL